MIGTLITETMAFDLAYQAAKAGNLIAREHWTGANKFVFMLPEQTLPYMVLLNDQQIPDAVKNYYIHRAEKASYEEMATIRTTSYLCMKNVDESLDYGWHPSTTDVLAEDWFIVSNF